MNINDRVKRLRESLGFNQTDFSSKVNIGRSTLSMFESGQRDLKDIHVSQICTAFNVNENWLRTGEGEMFIQSDVFSLDEYAKKNNLSELEMDIIRAYMDIDKEIRTSILSSLENVFNKHSEISVAEDTSTTYQTSEDDIEKELEAYRLELEAERKGRMSEVLGSGEEGKAN